MKSYIILILLDSTERIELLDARWPLGDVVSVCSYFNCAYVIFLARSGHRARVQRCWLLPYLPGEARCRQQRINRSRLRQFQPRQCPCSSWQLLQLRRRRCYPHRPLALSTIGRWTARPTGSSPDRHAAHPERWVYCRRQSFLVVVIVVASIGRSKNKFLKSDFVSLFEMWWTKSVQSKYQEKIFNVLNKILFVYVANRPLQNEPQSNLFKLSADGWFHFTSKGQRVTFERFDVRRTSMSRRVIVCMLCWFIAVI